MPWKKDKAIDFPSYATTHGTVKSDDLLGKWNILYFYPKDNTPGCTVETNDFNALLPSFKELNCEVYGISKDSIKSHIKFNDKFELNFELISDEDTSLCQKAGIYVEKSMYGRKYMGVERTTYLINPENVVVCIWEKVKVPNHAQAVLDQLRESSR